jgi:hypothetical protein
MKELAAGRYPTCLLELSEEGILGFENASLQQTAVTYKSTTPNPEVLLMQWCNSFKMLPKKHKSAPSTQAHTNLIKQEEGQD